MADSTSPIQQVIAGAGAAVQVNDNFDGCSPSMLYSRDAVTTTGLTWGFVGGRYRSSLIASGTVTLIASSTNYIVINSVDGVVSSSTTVTNWDDSTNYQRLYLAITGVSTVSSYEDHRQLFQSDKIVNLAIVTGIASRTISSSEMVAESIQQLTGTAAETFTLDTGTLLSTALPNAVAGDVVRFMVINSSTLTLTVLGDTGMTLANAITIQTLQSRLLTAINTSANNWTVY